MLEFLRQLQQQLPPFAFDLIKFSNGLLLLVILLVPLERRFALHPRATRRQGWWRDVGYYYLTSLLPNRLLAWPLGLLLIGLQYMPPALQAWSMPLPGWLRFALALFVAEVGFYWGHRWMHQVRWLWRFHAIHHGARQMDWLVNARAHPIDLLFMRLCGLVPLYLLGLVHTGAGQPDWVPLLVTLLGSMWGYFIHANLRWRLGWLGQLVSTPAFHHWHHNNMGASQRHLNYAPMLPWIDRLFGTYRVPRDAWPGAYGIDQRMDEDLLGQLLEPFTHRD